MFACVLTGPEALVAGSMNVGPDCKFSPHIGHLTHFSSISCEQLGQDGDCGSLTPQNGQKACMSDTLCPHEWQLDMDEAK